MPVRIKRTRHAPDGTEVPLESDAGLTVHETSVFVWPKRGPSSRALAEFSRFLGMKRQADGTSRSDRLEDFLAGNERVAKKILKEKGLPDWAHPIYYRVVGGSRVVLSRRRRVKLTQPGIGGCWITTLVEDRPHTPEWFAAHILEQITHVRDALKANNAYLAASAMLKLMGDLSLGRFKSLQESDVIRGLRTRRAASLGGRVRAAGVATERNTTRDQVRAAAREEWAAAQDASVRAVARRIARRRDGKPETIRKTIADLAPKKKVGK